MDSVKHSIWFSKSQNFTWLDKWSPKTRSRVFAPSAGNPIIIHTSWDPVIIHISPRTPIISITPEESEVCTRTTKAKGKKTAHLNLHLNQITLSQQRPVTRVQRKNDGGPHPSTCMGNREVGGLKEHWTGRTELNGRFNRKDEREGEQIPDFQLTQLWTVVSLKGSICI